MNDILALIHAALVVPDPTLSEEQGDRLHHRDLGQRTEADLRRELSFTRTMTYIVDSPWHAERELRIAEELRRRHDRANQARAQRRIVA